MGTGLNLPYYDFGRVESLTGLDLSEGMLRRAAGKVAGLGPAAAAKVRLVQGEAARLPFGAGEFDTVVLTYVLCVLDDPLGALREITRVCKREGRVVLVEQTASDLGPLAAYQRALAPAVRATSKGEARAPGGWAGEWALTRRQGATRAGTWWAWRSRRACRCWPRRPAWRARSGWWSSTSRTGSASPPAA